MSIVLYGGIGMKLVRTNRYTCTPVYSADGMDYLYTVHRYELTCIFNPSATSYALVQGVPIAAAGQSPVNTMTAIRHALLQPRQQLYIEHGAGQDTPLLVSPQNLGPLESYPCDAAGGPFPRGVYVVGLDNDKTWLVNWTVETALVECPTTSAPDPLLSNRFSQTSVVDSGFMTTLSTSGRAEFRTDVLEYLDQNADQFRQRVLPPIPTGYQRKNIVVAVDSRRNALTYEVVDRETYFDLGDTDPRNGGSGAIEVEGSYRVAGIRAAEGGVLGGMTAQTVDIRIKGQKTASQKRLLDLAVLIAMNKLPIGAAGGKSFIVQAAVSQSLTDPSMALSITMNVAPKDAGKADVPILNADGLLVDRFFAPRNGISPMPPHDGGTRGNATNTLVAAKLKAACANPKKPDGVGPPSSQDGPAYDGSSGPDVEVISASSQLPSTPMKYSSEAQEFPYDEYRFDVQYETDSGRMAVPLGGPAGDGGYVPGGGGGGPIGGDDGPGDMAFLTLSRPTTTKIIEGTASRIGQPPKLPKAETGDKNLCLLKQRVTAAAPELMPDGQTPVHRVSFKYQYGMKRSPKPTDDLFIGLIPIFQPSFASPLLKPAQFVGGLIAETVDSISGPVGGDS